MLTQLTTILVMLSLLLGGTGATVYAAQDSLPNEPLYQVKTISEDVRLDLASGSQAQLKLALGYAQQRMGEIEELVNKGEGVPQQVMNRLQTHLNYALNLAAGMEAGPKHQALEQIRANNQVMTQTVTRLRVNNPDQATMTQLQDMIQEQNRLVEMGLKDPKGSTIQHQSQYQSQPQYQYQYRWNINKETVEEVEETPEPEQPTILNSAPLSDTQKVGPCETCDQVQERTGPSYGPGPENYGETTMPDKGYGPAGDVVKPCETCDQVQERTGPSYGPGPENYGETTMPKEGGYGLGEPPAETPVPAEGGPGPGGEVEPAPNVQSGQGGAGGK